MDHTATATTFYVRRERVRDSSVRHLQAGGPSQVGKVAYSKQFDTRDEAQYEADAWAHSGRFAGQRYGQSDWIASVHEGLAPDDA